MTSSAISSQVILIADDDRLLNLVTADVLEEAGFTVLQAYSADEALVVLDNRPDIALLFTDIEMPGSMDGLALASMVRNHRPDIKIIVVSARSFLPDATPCGDCSFLRKPYRQQTLIAKIETLLGSGARRPGRDDRPFPQA